MRAAVSARLVPCRPVRICLHLSLQNIVISNEINGDGDGNGEDIRHQFSSSDICVAITTIRIKFFLPL